MLAAALAASSAVAVPRATSTTSATVRASPLTLTVRMADSLPSPARPSFPGRPGSAKVAKRAPAGSGWLALRWPAAGGHADVAQLVEHHLAKVRVAGSNPVVRSEAPDAVLRGRRSTWLRRRFVSRQRGRSGGVAEWLRQGPAKPCTRVRFPPPPRGRLAQWESATLTR